MSIFDWNDTAVVEARETPDQCAMFVGTWLFGVTRCDSPSTCTATMACVHEHVNKIDLCDECAAAQTSQPFFCNQCTDGPDSHECPVTTTTTPRVAVAS